MKEEKPYKPVPDVEALRYKGTPEKPDIKIFVSHRIDLDSETIDNPLYIPVRCGAVYDKRESIAMLGDDTGDNISEKREKYGEITVQYWAWKNIKADYYGLCHYRRYLSFSKHQDYIKNQFQLVEEKNISRESVDKFGLNESEIRHEIDSYDAILPQLFDIREINSNQNYTHRRRYTDQLGSNLANKSIDILLNTVRESCPEYFDTAKKYYSDSKAYFCNCFIMKKDVYFRYCEWLFDLLFKIESRIDFSKLSEVQTRIPGFLSEDLLSIFFLYNNQNLKTKELELVFFENTTRKICLKPAFLNRSINIILSCDNYYAPYMGVLIQSIIDHASDVNNYDIIILHTDISEENIALLKSLIANKENFSIRFIDITEEIGQRNFEVWAHYKKYNVYRLVAPELLKNYDKAVYLDSDIVVNTDLAKLYNVDLTGYLIAAIPEIRLHAWLNDEDNAIRTYVSDVLKLPVQHLYFNSGVLVYNLSEFRKTYTTEFLLNMCAQRRWKYIDQDVLNIVCANRTLYLPMTWNVEISVDNYTLEKNAPLSMWKDYKKAHNNPYVVHYAGNFMPCRIPHVDLYWNFWLYARRTPYYEQILARMIDQRVENTPIQIRQIENAILFKHTSFHYYKCKILSKILFGKKRAHYKQKYRALKEVRSYLRNLQKQYHL